MMAAEEGAEQVKTIGEDSGCSVPQVPVNEVNEKLQYRVYGASPHSFAGDYLVLLVETP